MATAHGQEQNARTCQSISEQVDDNPSPGSQGLRPDLGKVGSSHRLNWWHQGEATTISRRPCPLW